MNTKTTDINDAYVEADFIASVDPKNPGKSFNASPECFARYCNMQANHYQDWPLIAENMRQARDIADPEFRSKARASGATVNGTIVTY